MKYMLDTCAFIWYISDDSVMPEELKTLVDESNDVYISFATLWEIAIKQTTGKLSTVTMNVYELAEICETHRIMIAPLKLPYLERIKKMPLIHRDPFDRIIMATAIEEDYTLLTNDSEIIKYKDVKTLW